MFTPFAGKLHFSGLIISKAELRRLLRHKVSLKLPERQRRRFFRFTHLVVRLPRHPRVRPLALRLCRDGFSFLPVSFFCLLQTACWSSFSSQVSGRPARLRVVRLFLSAFLVRLA